MKRRWRFLRSRLTRCCSNMRKGRCWSRSTFAVGSRVIAGPFWWWNRRRRTHRLHWPSFLWQRLPFIIRFACRRARRQHWFWSLRSSLFVVSADVGRDICSMFVHFRAYSLVLCPGRWSVITRCVVHVGGLPSRTPPRPWVLKRRPIASATLLWSLSVTCM